MYVAPEVWFCPCWIIVEPGALNGLLLKLVNVFVPLTTPNRVTVPARPENVSTVLLALLLVPAAAVIVNGYTGGEAAKAGAGAAIRTTGAAHAAVRRMPLRLIPPGACACARPG